MPILQGFQRLFPKDKNREIEVKNYWICLQKHIIIGDNIKGDWLFMTKQDKENLQNKKLTDSLLFSCLAACESIISKNAYLEKKWANCGQSYNGCYQYERQLWMRYREKLRFLLVSIYSMKMIIQMTKSCKDKASKKEVLEVISLIDKNDYELM